MEYQSEVQLKNGKTCILRSGAAGDGAAALEVFLRTHEETDYLLTYPDESSFTAEQEAAFLEEKHQNSRELEILAYVDGILAGTAGIEAVGSCCKIAHRASFGIGILREYWGMGIGLALTQACIACARAAGYAQLELDVAAENTAAIALYEKVGFTEYGRNPRGFRSRYTGWQELVYMRLEL